MMLERFFTVCLSIIFVNSIAAQGQPEFINIEAGFSFPVGIVNASDGSDRLFIVEQAGIIKIIDNSAERDVVSVPFLDIRNRVDNSAGEEGLLGLVFHPNYENNGYFYVNYIHQLSGSGDPDVTRISRFSVDPNNPQLADPNSEMIIMDIAQPRNNHNAGDMHFGSDGYLYIATGDGGGSNDQFMNGQNLNSLLGCILRIDIDNQSGNNNYAIPADNPFVNNPSAKDEIWLYGLRNPWRFSFDPDTDDMHIADVGQLSREEVSIVPAGQSGLNLGWNCREGLIAFPLAPNNCNGTYHDPVFDYPRAKGRSITGGHVYRGTSFTDFDGWYFAIDYVTEQLFMHKSGTTIDMNISNVNSISSFGRSESGELYASSRGDGIIYRIIDRQACPLTLTIPTIINASNIAEASILSNAILPNGSQIFYGAPVVELVSGFSVPTAAQFEVDNKICGGQ